MCEIINIYYEFRCEYGYRRITDELNIRGYEINHKKVKRLMSIMGLYSKLIKKNKYKSYRGDVGKKADNIIERNFEADGPNKKWTTDVTEFKTPEGKLYLSPILDMYNSEIISYNISSSPNYNQITDMLDQAFEKHDDLEGLILHSDQGWQYQMDNYHKRLKEKGIIQSMSRKGNCIDNSIMESFFGVLKKGMYIGDEYTFKTKKSLEEAIRGYIDFYNNKRGKHKLKGLSPVAYREQSSSLSA